MVSNDIRYRVVSRYRKGSRRLAVFVLGFDCVSVDENIVMLSCGHVDRNVDLVAEKHFAVRDGFSARRRRHAVRKRHGAPDQSFDYRRIERIIPVAERDDLFAVETDFRIALADCRLDRGTADRKLFGNGYEQIVSEEHVIHFARMYHFKVEFRQAVILFEFLDVIEPPQRFPVRDRVFNTQNIGLAALCRLYDFEFHVFGRRRTHDKSARRPILAQTAHGDRNDVSARCVRAGKISARFLTVHAVHVIVARFYVVVELRFKQLFGNSGFIEL